MQIFRERTVGMPYLGRPYYSLAD